MSETNPNELSTRYEPQAFEAQIYAQWEAAGRFTADPEKPGKPFSIVIPPPNVTGYLHIGHALNNTLQDILTRWRRMAGDNVLWVPGTDHAGIATQHVVARELKKNEDLDWRTLGREGFLERVWDWKEQYGSRIIRQLKRLGSSCDWSRERFTMDDGLSRAVLTVFKKLYEEGLIYRGDYLVNWSTGLQTALSDDEVVHKEVEGRLYHLRYPLADGSGAIEVATTRPETMLGDTAVAVHPDDERYTALHGKMVKLPITGRLIPILPDGFVEREFGTGAVKVTPAHDPSDYEMGKRHGLPMINLLNPDGTLNANAGKFAGLKVAEARKQVVAELEAEGALIKSEKHVHQVGHCYRSGTVIEPYLSKQWFVKMQPLVGPALDAVKPGPNGEEPAIRFVPEHYENVYFHWLENVRDWCISRQLWWGHRIPIYTCDACGEVVCDIEGAPTACPKCGAEGGEGGKLRQDPDVLDTWFSSALWPFSTLGWPDDTAELKKYYPTSVLVTAHDIIFFWVARMIIMGQKFMGRAPFAKVVINPMVMDEHGKKMSKSSGTAIDPITVIDEMGADTIRLTLASYPSQSRHISLSEKRFETWRNFNNKLWNAARFVLGNVSDLDPGALAAGIDEADLELEDRWILGELAATVERANSALAAFEFDGYIDVLYKFIWNQYCDWYLELVKDRLHAAPVGASEDAENGNKTSEVNGGRGNARSRAAAQTVLVTVLEHVLRLMHPAAPFITEALWQQIRERFGEVTARAGATEEATPVRASHRALAAATIMIAPWPKVAEAANAGEVRAKMDLIQQAIGTLRTIRGEMNVPPGTATDVTVESSDAAQTETLRAAEHYMRSLVKVGALNFTDREDGVGELGFAATGIVGSAKLHVGLPESLRAEERARLAKEIARLEKGVAGSKGKLANAKFVESAPPEVVAAERERLAKLESELESLGARHTALG